MTTPSKKDSGEVTQDYAGAPEDTGVQDGSGILPLPNDPADGTDFPRLSPGVILTVIPTLLLLGAHWLRQGDVGSALSLGMLAGAVPFLRQSWFRIVLIAVTAGAVPF